jgi:hypothetical protein
LVNQLQQFGNSIFKVENRTRKIARGHARNEVKNMGSAMAQCSPIQKHICTDDLLQRTVIVGAVSVMLFTAGCGGSPSVADNYQPPAATQEQPFTVKPELDAHGLPYTARVLSESPYAAQQPPPAPEPASNSSVALADDGPPVERHYQPDSSFTNNLEAVGLVVGGTDLAKHVLRRASNTGTADVPKRVAPEVTTGTVARTGAADTTLAANTAATKTTAARTVAGTTEIETGTAARTLGRALVPAESDAVGLELRALGRALLWLGEECVLVFCR